jgi:translocation and assembly module TamB
MSRGKSIRRLLIATLASALGLVLWAGLLAWTGLPDRWARRAVVGEIENMTGGRVELRSFHFDWLHLRATLDGLTIHGREAASDAPLLHVDNLLVEIRTESLWRRAISLSRLEIERPAVNVRVAADGTSNVPTPRVRRAADRSWRERLFELSVGELRLDDGEMSYNDVRVPLAVSGRNLEFALDYATSSDRPLYIGEIGWKQMQFSARRYLPFDFDASAKFTLEPDALHVTQLVVHLPHSTLDAQADLASFARPSWDFRYRGWLDLADAREILRKPRTPGGKVEFTGDGRYGASQFSLGGHYSASEISMPYEWFHANGISTRGDYQADGRALDVPNLEVRGLGGTFRGRLHLDFPGLRFRVDTIGDGISVAQTLASVDHRGFPVKPLHWDAAMQVTASTQWNADFKNVQTRGVAIWTPPAAPAAGTIPAAARLDFDYSDATHLARIGPSEISTPSSHVVFQGAIAARASELGLTLDSSNLSDWADFINRIRGPDAEPVPIGGRVHWVGRVEGPIADPTFIGAVRAEQARYDDLDWDQIEGAMRYASDSFELQHTIVSRGRSSAQIDLSLELNKWAFQPDNTWSLDASVVRSDTDDLQHLFGWAYPAHGILTGEFHGRGTRAEPELSGLFDLTDVSGWGWNFSRARGELAVRHGSVRISNAELRLPAPSGASPGLLTGNLEFDTRTNQVALDVTGAAIPLESIARAQTSRLSVGGQLSFQLRARGPLLAPVLDGSLRIANLKLGGDVFGSFAGKLSSDGRELQVHVDSEMAAGHLEGQWEVSLSGGYPVQGDVTIEQMDLDPFLIAALHLRGFTGHSLADGHFAFAGFLAQPDTLAVEANLSRIVLNYQTVQLENAAPVSLTYRRSEVRIDHASLRGPESDFSVSGAVSFAGRQPLDLRVAGAVNLRLLGGFLPAVQSAGRAQVDASIGGTLVSPRVNGKLHVADASASFGDFPAGLSHVTGDFDFDATRLIFDNVTAESGGGTLALSGTVNYGESPLRYDLNARSTQVRIRYPVGMSWLAGGTLRLAGDSNGGTLSGNVAVSRLLMSEGFDPATLLVSSGQPVSEPSTASPFLRNLQFDLEADSSPDARLQWPGADFQVEASLRVRGTWEHPILLGHIHLLTGQMAFRGNQYRLSRGELNFSNPFRLDPVLNVEAATTIQQYEVTLDFTGPASRLTLAYRSDPPLPSSDIIALLALGQTGEESNLRGPTAVQTPEMGATTLLSEAISSQLGGRIERLFGISHFSVDPFLGGPTSTQTAAARVTIEQQVTRDLTVTYITNVSSTQEQVIQIEYNINRSLSVVALRDENGTFGIDFIVKKRFK